LREYFSADPGLPFTGFESSQKIETSIRNVLEMMNDQLETNLKFVWDGFLDDFTSTGSDSTVCNEIPTICTNHAFYSQPGYILIKALSVSSSPAATDCTPQDWRGDCPAGVGCGTENCNVFFYDKTPEGIDRQRGLTQAAPGRLFQSSLHHELLHDVGMIQLSDSGGNQQTFEPFSTMHSSDSGRFPWHEDCFQVIEPPSGDPGYTQYSHRSGLRIRHVVSPNGGTTWYYGTDSNLTQYSNDHVDVSVNGAATPPEFILAFSTDSIPKRIKTIKGTATSTYSIAWNVSTMVDHGPLSESWFGPSVAFGSGQWVLVWSNKGEDNNLTGVNGRAIYYSYSFDGVSWTEPVLLAWSCSGCSATDYGALGSPVVRYNAGENRFVVVWVNWYSATRTPFVWDEIGRVRQCTLIPGIFTTVSNCNELQDYYGKFLVAWHTPAVSCHFVYDSCFVTTTPDDGDADNFFVTYFASLAPDDSMSMSISPAGHEGWTSRNELSSAYGNSSHYIAYRGQNDNHWLNVGRWDANLPGWSDKHTLGLSIWAGPAVVVGPSDDVRIYYVAP